MEDNVLRRVIIRASETMRMDYSPIQVFLVTLRYNGRWVLIVMWIQYSETFLLILYISSTLSRTD
jgi:hypothetical protein